MKYVIPILLIASVLFISGSTGQAISSENSTISEAEWINPPPELTGETTTTETTIAGTTTTTFAETIHWFDTAVEAMDFKQEANLTGSDYTAIDCVERYNSDSVMAWKCELV